MLTNHHTKSHKKWYYLTALPVVGLLLLAFQVSEFEHFAPSGEIPSMFPLPEQYKEEITWGFHEKAIHPFSKQETLHEGLDIAAPLGTPVFAVASGVIKKAELLGGWGNLVVIEHADGYASFYAHLEGFKVKSGDKVTKGQVVATVGSTGISTGHHLHFELRKEGVKVNPEEYY